MIEASRIAEVLGGEKILKQNIRSLSELDDIVRRGLPKGALRVVARHLALDSRTTNRIIYQIVPEATYKRRRVVLNPTESERTERLARVIATAEYVWDDADEAKRFLTTPHPLLEGRTPYDAGLTELGARQVEGILWNLFYGIPA